jgi:hypothetical protein
VYTLTISSREVHVSLASLLVPLCVLGASPPDASSGLAAIASVQVSKTSLVGGGSLLVAVTLTAPAPLGGSSVNIAYSNQSVLASPQKGITIPQGQSSGNFTLTTVPTAANVTVTVTGSLGSSSASTTVTVRAPQVKTASLPGAIQGGTTTQLSVTIDGPAPPGGSLLQLSFTPNIVAVLPTTFSFDLGGSYFGCGMELLLTGDGCTQTVTVSDSANLLVVPAGGTTKTINLAVPAGREDRAVAGTVSLGNPISLNFTIRRPRPNDAAFVASCSTSAEPITRVAGPASLQFRVRTFDRVPRSGAYVNLSVRSSTPVPPTTLELDQGGTGPVHYGCLSINLPAVTQTSSLMLIAEGGGATKSASISNIPLTVSSIVLSKDSVTSGTQVTATITMSAAAPSDATIQLSSSNATAAPLPASVTVVQGAPTATVSFVPRVPLTSVSPQLKVIVSATYQGSTRADTLIVSR